MKRCLILIGLLSSLSAADLVDHRLKASGIDLNQESNVAQGCVMPDGEHAGQTARIYLKRGFSVDKGNQDEQNNGSQFKKSSLKRKTKHHTRRGTFDVSSEEEKKIVDAAFKAISSSSSSSSAAPSSVSTSPETIQEPQSPKAPVTHVVNVVVPHAKELSELVIRKVVQEELDKKAQKSTQIKQYSLPKIVGVSYLCVTSLIGTYALWMHFLRTQNCYDEIMHT